jgi:hypothetical protein
MEGGGAGVRGGIRNQGSGIGGQESGVRSQESGVRNWELGALKGASNSARCFSSGYGRAENRDLQGRGKGWGE